MADSTPLEIKKDGLSQLQDGSWVLKMKVNPFDMPTSLMQAPMGTRYMAALVEIGDDEQPVEQPTEKPKERRSFHELPYSQQAALTCERATFHTYLREEHGVGSPEDVPDYVRDWCQISSRSELDTNEEAAARWRDLYSKFKAWEQMG